MKQRVLTRLFASAGVVFGAVTLIFLVLNWLPGDPAELIAGESANQETINHIRAQLQTDRPLWQQYRDYLFGVAHGDLGRSYVTHEPVLDRLSAHLPATLSLTLSAAVVALVVGLGLGVLAARHHGRPLDQLIQLVSLSLASVPPFWLGLLAILLFSVRLGWLPILGNGGFAASVLPVMSLGLVVSVHLQRMVRSSILEELNEPYVTALLAKGLGESRVFYVHVLRNALIASITLLGVLVGELLSGTVVTETLFARQGLGRVAVEAIGQKDLPVVQGAILLVSLMYVGVNLLVDLSYAWIDPRVSSDNAQEAR
jgi:ABC-type dipeptide/oligopeptide/nickel transport system permease component